jgi:hypothetical protein
MENENCRELYGADGLFVNNLMGPGYKTITDQYEIRRTCFPIECIALRMVGTLEKRYHKLYELTKVIRWDRTKVESIPAVLLNSDRK